MTMLDCQTAGCRHEAVVCDECVRALALMFFGGIARHPEERERGDDGCALCEVGPRWWCAGCAIGGEHGVVARRAALRKLKEYRTGPLAIRLGRDIEGVAHEALERFGGRGGGRR